MKLPSSETLVGSVIAQVAISTLRGILNRAIRETTPKMLVEAIRDNTSLWGEANPVIMDYVQDLPPFIATGIKEAREIINFQYGGVTHIVMQWLETDNPLYYNIIKNSEGGEVWIGRQVEQILDGVQDNVGKKEDVK